MAYMQRGSKRKSLLLIGNVAIISTFLANYQFMKLTLPNAAQST